MWYCRHFFAIVSTFLDILWIFLYQRYFKILTSTTAMNNFFKLSKKSEIYFITIIELSVLIRKFRIFFSNFSTKRSDSDENRKVRDTNIGLLLLFYSSVFFFILFCFVLFSFFVACFLFCFWEGVCFLEEVFWVYFVFICFTFDFYSSAAQNTEPKLRKKLTR